MRYPPGRLLNPSKLSGLCPLLAAAFLLAATPAPKLALEIRAEQTTYDPLDAVAIRLSVRNPSASPVLARFAQTGEYALSLADGARVVWKLPADPGPPHARAFAPGTTALVVYEWNGILADGTAPRPGIYTLAATLQDGADARAASVPIRVAAPLPISALISTDTQSVTVSGTLDAGGGTLSDASGSVRLARRILRIAAGTLLDVRGSMAKQPDGSSALYVERWAPAERSPEATALPTGTPHA